MAEITAGMVKELRERPGLGMMDCKKALVEANGDMEKAIDDLRKASGLKAAKKAGRIAAEGVVLTKVSDDGNFGIIVEVNSETDFVARDENFLSFANKVINEAFTRRVSDVAALMAGDLEKVREALVQKIGENINVRRIQIVEFKNPNVGIVDTYIHSNNRIAVVVALKGGEATLAKDIAMHVAAVNPLVVRSEDVPKELLAKESEIYSAQARESGKPEELRKYVAEVSLLDQPFVKDGEITVAALLKKAGADVVSFIRYEVGEGIEKEVVDFASEVAAVAGL